jgi:hypothetical protein
VTPKVEFDVSRIINEFCHLSVLYSDLLPPELATGILHNKDYQERNWKLRDDAVRLQFQKTGAFSSAVEWYEFAAGLLKRASYGGFESLSDGSRFAELFKDLRQRRATGFDEIWKEARPRLIEYQYDFSSQWSPISDRVLLRLHELARSHWQTDKICVQYIDCLYGGFAWNDCIGITAFPDMNIQKKLLAHELSEIITPQRVLREELQKAGLDLGITHTVIDMLAYFSVRDFLARTDPPDHEKKGLRPNPRYYPAADVLFPVFERYAENPRIYPDFSDFVQEMILVFQPTSRTSVKTVSVQ